MIDKLKKIIKEELDLYFKNVKYNLKDELMIEEAIILGELLNPDNSFEYEGSRGFYTYKDSVNNIYFVRLTFQPASIPYFEFKTGWMDGNIAKYDPSIPPNSTTLDGNKRSDTVAKIYRDEILPFFDSQDLSDIIVIKPISVSREKFTKRLIQKFTDSNKYNIIHGDVTKITKK